MPAGANTAPWRLAVPAAATNGSSGDGATATAPPAVFAATITNSGAASVSAGPTDGVLVDLDDAAAAQGAAPATVEQATGGAADIGGSADAASGSRGEEATADGSSSAADAGISVADLTSALPALAPGERAPVVRERLATVISRNFGDAPNVTLHVARSRGLKKCAVASVLARTLGRCIHHHPQSRAQS